MQNTPTLTAEMTLNDFVAYVHDKLQGDISAEMCKWAWTKYPNAYDAEAHLFELYNSLDSHPARAVLLNQLNTEVIGSVGEWQLEAKARIERYTAQFKRLVAAEQADIDFIDEVLMPRIVQWAKQKYKDKHIDTLKCRLQLRESKETFVLNSEALPNPETLYSEEQVIEILEQGAAHAGYNQAHWQAQWHIFRTNPPKLAYNLPAAKQQAVVVMGENNWEMIDEEADIPDWLQYIPDWLQYKPALTGSFCVAPEVKKKKK